MDIIIRCSINCVGNVIPIVVSACRRDDFDIAISAILRGDITHRDLCPVA